MLFKEPLALKSHHEVQPSKESAGAPTPRPRPSPRKDHQDKKADQQQRNRDKSPVPATMSRNISKIDTGTGKKEEYNSRMKSSLDLSSSGNNSLSKQNTPHRSNDIGKNELGIESNRLQQPLVNSKHLSLIHI